MTSDPFHVNTEVSCAAMTSSTREDLSKWQRKALELAESIIPQRTADYFIQHVNFVRTPISNGRTRIHNIGHIDEHLQRVAKGVGKYKHTHDNIVLVNPTRRDISRMILRISGIDVRTQTIVVFPEGDEAMMIRTLAIGAILQRCPIDCLPFIQKIRCKTVDINTNGSNSGLIHGFSGPNVKYFEITFTNEIQTKLQLPIITRPIGVAHIRSNCQTDAWSLANQLINAEVEMLNVGPPNAADINEGWSQITFAADHNSRDLADPGIPDAMREHLIEQVNTIDDNADLTVCYLDAHHTFYLVRCKSSETRSDLRKEINVIRRSIVMSSRDPSPFTYALLNNSMMMVQCSRLETLCELVNAAARRNIHIMLKPEDGAAKIGQDSEGYFTANPIGAGAIDHEYHVIKLSKQLFYESDLREIDQLLLQMSRTGHDLNPRPVHIQYGNRKIYAIQVRTRDKLGQAIPLQIGNGKYEIGKGTKLNGNKFQAIRQQVPPHSTDDVAQSLQNGTSQHRGKRIYFNDAGDGGYIFKRILREFNESGCGKEQWYMQDGSYRGLNTGIAIIEGHRAHVVGSKIVEKCGHVPNNGNIDQITDWQNGVKFDLAKYVNLDKPIIAIVRSATINVEMYEIGKRSTKAAVFCRVDITVPNEATIVAWGQAVHSIRITPHDDDRASVAVANCQGKKTCDQYATGSQPVHSYCPTFNTCQEMTHVKKSAQAMPIVRRLDEGDTGAFVNGTLDGGTSLPPPMPSLNESLDECMPQQQQAGDLHTCSGGNEGAGHIIRSQLDTDPPLRGNNSLVGLPIPFAPPRAIQPLTAIQYPATQALNSRKSGCGNSRDAAPTDLDGPTSDVTNVLTSSNDQDSGGKRRQGTGHASTLPQLTIGVGGIGEGHSDQVDLTDSPTVSNDIEGDPKNPPGALNRSLPNRQAHGPGAESISAEHEGLRNNDCQTSDGKREQAEAETRTPNTDSSRSDLTERDIDQDIYVSDCEGPVRRNLNAKLDRLAPSPTGQACQTVPDRGTQGNSKYGPLIQCFKRQKAKPYLLTATAIAIACHEQQDIDNDLLRIAKQAAVRDAMRASTGELKKAIDHIMFSLNRMMQQNRKDGEDIDYDKLLHPGNDVRIIHETYGDKLGICNKYDFTQTCNCGKQLKRRYPISIIDDTAIAQLHMRGPCYYDQRICGYGPLRCAGCDTSSIDVEADIRPVADDCYAILQIPSEAEATKYNDRTLIATVTLGIGGNGRQDLTIYEGTNAGITININTAVDSPSGDRRSSTGSDHAHYGIYAIDCITIDDEQYDDTSSQIHEDPDKANCSAIKRVRGEVRSKRRIYTADANDDAVLSAIQVNKPNISEVWSLECSDSTPKSIEDQSNGTIVSGDDMPLVRQDLWFHGKRADQLALVYVPSGAMRIAVNSILNSVFHTGKDKHVIVLFEDQNEHVQCLNEHVLAVTSDGDFAYDFQNGEFVCSGCGQKGHGISQCEHFKQKDGKGDQEGGDRSTEADLATTFDLKGSRLRDFLKPFLPEELLRQLSSKCTKHFQPQHAAWLVCQRWFVDLAPWNELANRYVDMIRDGASVESLLTDFEPHIDAALIEAARLDSAQGQRLVIRKTDEQRLCELVNNGWRLISSSGEGLNCLADTTLLLLAYHGILQESVLIQPTRAEASAAFRSWLLQQADLYPLDCQYQEDQYAYLQHHRHAEPAISFFVERFADYLGPAGLPINGITLNVYSRLDGTVPGDTSYICGAAHGGAGSVCFTMYNHTGGDLLGRHYDAAVKNAIDDTKAGAAPARRRRAVSEPPRSPTRDITRTPDKRARNGGVAGSVEGNHEANGTHHTDNVSSPRTNRRKLSAHSGNDHDDLQQSDADAQSKDGRATKQHDVVNADGDETNTDGSPRHHGVRQRVGHAFPLHATGGAEEVPPDGDPPVDTDRRPISDHDGQTAKRRVDGTVKQHNGAAATGCVTNGDGNLQQRDTSQGTGHAHSLSFSSDVDGICGLCKSRPSEHRCAVIYCKRFACNGCLIASKTSSDQLICPQHENEGLSFGALRVDNLLEADHCPEALGTSRSIEDGPPVKKHKTSDRTTTDKSTPLPNGAVVFSLFDGGGNSWEFIDEIGIRPLAFCAAESDTTIGIRPLVGTQHGYSADDRQWTIGDRGCPCIYACDAWDLLSTHDGSVAKTVKEAVSYGIGNGHKYIIFGGPPCLQVTTASWAQGAIGFCGKDSVHLHVFHALVATIHYLDPSAEIFIAVENAGSMKKLHRDYFHEALGMPPSAVKEINTADWTNVERRRCVLSSAEKCGPNPARLEVDFDDGFERHPIAGASSIAPLMTPRRCTPLGNPVWTDSYHTIRHLLFAEEKCDPHMYERMIKEVIDIDGSLLMPVDFRTVLPKEVHRQWECLQSWDISKAKCAYFRKYPGCQLAPGNDNNRITTQVLVFSRNTKDHLITVGEGEHLYVEGDGAPFEPGDGKIAVRVVHVDGQGARTPGRVEVDQVWPFQADRRYVVGMKYTGFPVDAFARSIEELLTVLADQAKSLPFRQLNIKEREKAVQYDKIFSKEQCRKTHANDYLIGHITGNAYSVNAIVKAVGGVNGPLRQFLHGERNPSDYRPIVPSFSEMRRRYARLYNDVLKEGGKTVHVGDLVKDPFPPKVHPLIKAIEQGTLGEPCTPTLYRAIAFRPIIKTLINSTQVAKAGHTLVVPSRAAIESIRPLVARAEGITDDPMPRIRFIAPDTNAGTIAAAGNIAKAIIELATHGGTQDTASHRLFLDRAKENGAEGGNGLFPANVPDKDGKHTAFSQAARIMMSTIVGLVYCNDDDVNCVFVEGKQYGVVGKTLAANTIVATFSGKKMHLDHICRIAMCPSIAAGIPPFDPAAIKYGPDDGVNGPDRSALDRALADRGLIRPYLTKTAQGTATRAILYDTCYALLGRPISFNGADIQPLISIALPVANQQICDDDVLDANYDAVTRVYLAAANIVRAAACQIALSDLKESTRRIIANILSTDQITFFRADATTHDYHLDLVPRNAKNAVCLRTLDAALQNELTDDIRNQKTNLTKFGRRFATEDHITTAFFAHDNDIAKRTAITSSSSAAKKDTGHKYTIQEARKLFQSCTPLHQLTPEMHAAFMRHRDQQL